jgi:hypothetical protein
LLDHTLHGLHGRECGANARSTMRSESFPVMKMKAVETRHGVIYGRNALIVTATDLTVHPMTLTVKASLSLSNCMPEILDAPDVNVTFVFTDIEHLSVCGVEAYPNEEYTDSSFDLVEGTYGNDRKRIVLSSYDHVFDVVGQCDVIYG